MIYKYKISTETTWSKVLLKKLIMAQIFQEIPAVYGTWTFVTVFTTASHMFLSRWKQIQFKPSHTISLKYILILSFHLRLSADLPRGLSPLRPLLNETNSQVLFTMEVYYTQCSIHNSWLQFTTLLEFSHKCNFYRFSNYSEYVYCLLASALVL
jgi:hypothetical protein